MEKNGVGQESHSRYYLLIAAKCAISGVFTYYPHPGGQA